MEDSFVVEYLDHLNAVIQGFVMDSYAVVANFIAAPLMALVTLMVVGLGIGIMAGWVTLSLRTLMTTAIKVAAVIMAVLHWHTAVTWLYQLLYEGSMALGTQILTHLPSTVSTHSDSLQEALQHFSDNFMDAAVILFKQVAWHHFLPLFSGAVVMGLGLTLVTVSLFEYSIGFILLAVLLIVLPLMAVFALFKSTQSIFHRWCGALLSSALLVVLVSVVLGFSMHFIHWSLEAAGQGWKQQFHGLGRFVMMTSICLMMLKRVASLAYSLGGTFAGWSGAESAVGAVQMLRQGTGQLTRMMGSSSVRQAGGKGVRLAGRGAVGAAKQAGRAAGRLGQMRLRQR